MDNEMKQQWKQLFRELEKFRKAIEEISNALDSRNRTLLTWTTSSDKSALDEGDIDEEEAVCGD